jgi:hypothetical protein
MKKIILIFTALSLAISCSDNDDNLNQTFEAEGRFVHEIPGCENDSPYEFNCIDFIEFVDNSKVDILIGGGDILYRVGYSVKGNKIILKKSEDFNLDVSFQIQNESELTRIEDNQVWLKKE